MKTLSVALSGIAIVLVSASSLPANAEPNGFEQIHGSGYDQGYSFSFNAYDSRHDNGANSHQQIYIYDGNISSYVLDCYFFIGEDAEFVDVNASAKKGETVYDSDVISCSSGAGVAVVQCEDNGIYSYHSVGNTRQSIDGVTTHYHGNTSHSSADCTIDFNGLSLSTVNYYYNATIYRSQQN